MPSPRIQFRALDEMGKEVRKRTSIPQADLSTNEVEALMSETARRDLERYYDLLTRSLPKFSAGEAMLLADVLNGTIHAPYSVSLLWAQVSDAVQDGYAQKWQIDGSALVERLRSLTPFECMAIADAIERAWNTQEYRVLDMEERVREVGLCH